VTGESRFITVARWKEEPVRIVGVPSLKPYYLYTFALSLGCPTSVPLLLSRYKDLYSLHPSHLSRAQGGIEVINTPMPFPHSLFS
jgi:hypothetical protein